MTLYFIKVCNAVKKAPITSFRSFVTIIQVFKIFYVVLFHNKLITSQDSCCRMQFIIIRIIHTALDYFKTSKMLLLLLFFIFDG